MQATLGRGMQAASPGAVLLSCRADWLFSNTGAGAGGLGFLWPWRVSVFSNGQHLRFDLCRQLQVPSAGKASSAGNQSC